MAARGTADHVDEVVEQWRRQHPDLDFSPMATIGRLARLFGLASVRVEATLNAHGLTTAEFDVLATLRRSGAPFELSPTHLARWAMLSSGAMTNRLDRLEAGGLVRRRPDPEDRRALRVRLTDEGRRLVDAALPDHLATEAALLAPLSAADRRRLDALLRKLLEAL